MYFPEGFFEEIIYRIETQHSISLSYPISYFSIEDISFLDSYPKWIFINCSKKDFLFYIKCGSLPIKNFFFIEKRDLVDTIIKK
jgi:hypothetical protein